MRARHIHAGPPLALLTFLPLTIIATPRVTDDLLLPLRIPQQRCPDFAPGNLIIPPSIQQPATKCSWHEILKCGAEEIECGPICVGTVQGANPTILLLQCRTCLSPSTVTHCATCFGTHIPTGFSPQTYASAPSISHNQLCSTAKAIPEAGCIVQGFCPDDPPPPPSSSTSEDSKDPMAVVAQIIEDLGPSAVPYVEVQ
ncbi:MAG: hypothetical protein Q9172_001673 [Xanthocarpia lactea]